MSSLSSQIAVPAEGITIAYVKPSNPYEVHVRFEDPLQASQFSDALREGRVPTNNDYHHVVINEEHGDASFAYHFVLLISDGKYPAACADHMALTLNNHHEDDLPMPVKTDQGYVDSEGRCTYVLKSTPLDRFTGEAMARHLQTCNSEHFDLSIEAAPTPNPQAMDRG